MRRAIVACALVACAAVGCKKTEPEAIDAAPTAPPPAQTATEEPTTTTAPTFVPPPIEQNPDVVVLGVDTTVIPGEAPKPPPPVDPYVAVIDAARASAVGCFSPLPAGTYAATIVVTITPAGTPVDVEVQPGNVTDASVIACLKQVGEGRSYPSTPNGRTIRIDVRVQG